MLMQQSHRESFWIGLDDLGEEHVHRWADGSKMNYQNGEFNRYPNGQPDKVYFSEDCVEEVKTNILFSKKSNQKFFGNFHFLRASKFRLSFSERVTLKLEN